MQASNGKALTHPEGMERNSRRATAKNKIRGLDSLGRSQWAESSLSVRRVIEEKDKLYTCNVGLRTQVDAAPQSAW
jgi:hypothetical protein